MSISANDAFIYDNRGLTAIKRAEQRQKNSGLKPVAQQFEAIFINMMLKTMRQSLPNNDPLNSDALKMMQSMQDEQTAQSLAKKGMGLADLLVKQLTLPQHRVIEPSSIANLPSGQPIKPLVRNAPLAPASADLPKMTLAQIAPHVANFLQQIGPSILATAKSSGIPAKLMMAQAALETNWGRNIVHHDNNRSSHNWFGIKATQWNGEKIEAKTQEFEKNQWYTQKADFRSYASDAHALANYADLITRNPRYAKIVNQSPEVGAYTLQNQGYATDPAYAQKLIKIMQQLPNSLEQMLSTGPEEEA